MAAAMNFWEGLGRQLRCPSGQLGGLVGHLMALMNKEPNRLAIEALDIGPTDTVLELGFGPGKGIERLANVAPQGHVLGIDQSQAMLAQARRRNRQAVADGRVELKLGRFDALPWPSGMVNKILAVNVVYFFHGSGRDLVEARRLLRPGGIMTIYATDRSTMSRWKFSGPDTHALFDRATLSALTRRGGFAPEEISMHTLALPFGISGLLAILRKRGPGPLPRHREALPLRARAGSSSAWQ